MPIHETNGSVIVIGAGAAGLSTAAALAHRGIRASILDQDADIGGTWVRRYQCLKLHTIRRYSGLAHYPIPKDQPSYLSKDEYAAYLKEYASVLGLDVQTGEKVGVVCENPAGSNGMKWEVKTNRATRMARIVIIATGHYAEPYMPIWEGIEKYRGILLHSSQYTTGALYSGQKVLVVGLGNSGAEIAADLSAHGVSSTSVSVKTTPPIVAREMFNIIPVQLFGIALMPLGMPRIIDRIGAILRYISIGDLTEYGLGPAAWGPFTSRKPAVIDAGFLKQLKRHRVVVRRPIAKFNETSVSYDDGTSETIDVVIAATGFRTGLEKFLKVPGVIDNKGQPRFPSGTPTSASGLYFIGFDETIRGHLFEINRESKRLATEADRYLRCSA